MQMKFGIVLPAVVSFYSWELAASISLDMAKEKAQEKDLSTDFPGVMNWTFGWVGWLSQFLWLAWDWGLKQSAFTSDREKGT